MSDVVRNLIQYAGIADHIPESSDVFKQLNIEDTFCLPIEKPNIEQITKVIGEISIKSTKVIRTPKGVSLEGQQLTGWKLVIEGWIKIKLQYVADEPTQTVHAAHAYIPFSTYIVLPDNFIMGTPVMVHEYIEDIFTMQMDKRCIFNNITILLTADFC
jgi:hypothetical protein